MSVIVAAVIDIGSNSARLQIAEVDGSAIRELRRDRIMLRLAAAIDDRGAITGDGIRRTAAAVARFVTTAAGYGVTPVTVATSAIRDATNRAVVVRAVEAAAPVRLRLLSGEEEARLAATGAVLHLPMDRGMVLDLGGGSCELAVIRQGAWAGGWSWPLGALRTAIRLVHDDPPAPAEVEAIREAVHAAMSGAAVPRLDPGATLIGTGGNARALAKLATDGEAGGDAHGTVIDRPLVRGLARRLARATYRERTRMTGADPERADSMHVGVAIIDAVMGYVQAPSLTVSAGGLREGLLIEASGKVGGSEHSEGSG